MNLTEIDAALEVVAKEISDLEVSLRDAKGRQKTLQQQRVKAAAEQEQAKQNEIQAYEAKIAAIKAQIAKTEAAAKAKAAAKPPGAPLSPVKPPAYIETYDEEEEYEEEVVEEYTEYEEEEILEEEEVIEEYVVEEEEPAAQGPVHGGSTAAATHVQLETNPSQFDYSAVRKEQMNDMKKQNQWNKPAYAQPTHATQTYGNHKTPGHSFLTDQREVLKQKYQFDKPAWASHNSADTAAANIDTNPIQNPLLKTNNASGYTRQVFEKEKLHRSQGKFVAPRSKVPPRLAWIVVDINKKKAGKIVLHLHGLGTDETVEQFPSLVGMTLGRQGNNKPIFVEELTDPKFFITTNSKVKGVDERKDTYGLVQEGKEVIAAIKNSDEHAGITIRQSHVFPVKRAK